MLTSKSPASRSRRRLVRASAVGIALSLCPLVGGSASVSGDTPAVAVTGLSRGARGEAVRSVQQALVNQGVPVAGGVDGIFGAGTEQAVKDFQSSAGLSPSGVVDAATALALGLASSDMLGLTQGNRGAAVLALQKALVDHGLNPAGGVDGIFGPGTKAAVQAFQSEHGLQPNGVVDAATVAALSATSSEPGGPGEAADPTDEGLRIGARGGAVKKLQEALIGAGLNVAGGADGIFGPGTKAAVVAFQTEHGLQPSGIVETATLAALEATSGGGSADPAAGSDENDDPADEGGSVESPFLGLKIGARGETVQKMQQALIHSGFNVVGGADGIFGVLTANALSSFQHSHGLAANAVVDVETAKHLDETSAAKGETPGSGEGGSNAASPLFGLRYGSLGSDVEQLQQRLIDLGVRVRGGADGVFGTATQAALKEFQQSEGLPQSGIVDDATAGALASSDGVSGAAGSSPFLGLKAGSLGNSVKGLQQALIDAGVRVRGGADGIFGPATASALKDFQTSQGLPGTGVVDAVTIAALSDPKPPTDSTVEVGGFAVYGEKGSRVLALQAALVEAGIALRGGIDGSFGGGTSAAVMEFQRQNGLSVTGKVSDATAAALGLERAPAPTAVFPVQGSCYYGDSWGYPRGGGRAHLGVDIIAPAGKLLYAVTDGRVTKVYKDYPGSLAGNGVRLTMDDGTYFFYAHMSEIADGIELGVPVKAGQVLGYVGNTGNSGTNHLHFEVHPKGGAAVNPYPLVQAIDACDVTDPLPPV
jgi:peptidoglycan hydrolase-like protein with peptidoglycan-binding domain